ncbi:MAG: cell division protein ZapA [Sphingomonadales bacterium]|jgi:cell division protein ZapA|tara:strand:- start:11 stop:343 length:333 start_codon:yes stop_codon:yes gene_type:complete
MGQVSVNINNHNYTLACRDGEEDRLIELASFVNKKAENLTKNLGNVGENRLLLMSALLMADELKEAWERLEKLEQNAPDVLDDVSRKKMSLLIDKASEKIEGIAAELEAY